MLFRQRHHIQELHQVQYRFDALQSQFTNDLRAFHNQRRRWTTQARFGFVDHNQNQVPLNFSPFGHPNPSTPSTPHPPLATPFSNPNPSNLNSTSLHSAIHLLNLNVDTLHALESRPNLNHLPVPPSPVNSISSDDLGLYLNLEGNVQQTLHGDLTVPPQEPTSSSNQITSFSS